MPVAFKPILPKALKEQVFLDEIKAAAEVARKGILKDYQAGVKDWDHKVVFESEVVISGGGVGIVVDTDDQIYTYVHDGTKPHVIKPKKPGGKLRFQGTYTAKTVPGVIQSRPGGASGEVLYSATVNHPGTKARNFSKPILKKWKPFLGRQLQRALNEAARKSGHAI